MGQSTSKTAFRERVTAVFYQRRRRPRDSPALRGWSLTQSPKIVCGDRAGLALAGSTELVYECERGLVPEIRERKFGRRGEMAPEKQPGTQQVIVQWPRRDCADQS